MIRPMVRTLLPSFFRIMERVHLSILLAEDDEDDALIARGVLSEITEFCSYVDWVSTHEAAAEQICDNQHDVYLFDYSLGAKSGLDLLNLARERGCQAPVIIFSGQTGNDLILKAIHAGASDYLVKGQYDAEVMGRSIRYSLERKRAETALRVSEGRYRNLVENTTEVVFCYDWQGRLTAVNRSMERVTGYSRDELTMMSLANLLTKESLEVLDDMCVRQMAGERTAGCEMELLAKSGAVIPMDVSSTLITDGSRPVEFQAVGRMVWGRG